jgi:hypothetical protein
MNMNMKKQDFRYVQFPLYLLRHLHFNKDQAIEDIFNAGVYRYREKMDKSTFNAFKEALFAYLEGKLPDELRDALKTHIDNGSLTLPKYREGIRPATDHIFDNKLLEFLLNKHDDLERSALEYYQVVKALVEYHDPKGELHESVKRVITNGRRINQSIPKGEPMPMIKVDHLISFYKRKVEEFELVKLTAYIGIKSILGQKKFCKTNKEHILARMFGFKSTSCVPEELPESIQQLYSKYSTRRKMDTLIKQIEEDWHLKFYSKKNIRGIWVGKENVSYKELIFKAEESKSKSKAEAIKQEKKKAYDDVKKELKNNNG